MLKLFGSILGEIIVIIHTIPCKQRRSIATMGQFGRNRFGEPVTGHGRVLEFFLLERELALLIRKEGYLAADHRRVLNFLLI